MGAVVVGSKKDTSEKDVNRKEIEDWVLGGCVVIEVWWVGCGVVGDSMYGPVEVVWECEQLSVVVWECCVGRRIDRASRNKSEKQTTITQHYFTLLLSPHSTQTSNPHPLSLFTLPTPPQTTFLTFPPSFPPHSTFLTSPHLFPHTTTSRHTTTFLTSPPFSPHHHLSDFTPLTTAHLSLGHPNFQFIWFESFMLWKKKRNKL
jgi:hypothetical protein